MKSKPLHLTKRIEILEVVQKEIIVYSRVQKKNIVIPKHIHEHAREAIDRYMRKNLPPAYALIDLSISGKHCVGLAVKKDFDWFIIHITDSILARSDKLKGIPLSKLYEREYRKTILDKGDRKLYILRDKFHITVSKPEQQVLDDLAYSQFLEKEKRVAKLPNLFKDIKHIAEGEKRKLIVRKYGMSINPIYTTQEQREPFSKLDPCKRRFIIKPNSEAIKNPLIELDLAKIEARLLANSLPKETQLLFGESKMSVSHKVNTLMNVTGIKVRFKGQSIDYTYKTLLPNVKVDEEIVVETSIGNAVATVTKILGKVSQEVTKEIVNMGYDNIKWAFQSVADLRLQELKDTEKELYDNIVLAEGVTANKEVLQDLEESIGKENVTELKAKVSRL